MISWNESDVEDYLFEHPEVINAGLITVNHWVARQYHVPSGIIDLLGAMKMIPPYGFKYFPVLVEIKNRPARSEDFAQICRYSHDIQEIFYSLDIEVNPHKILLAPGSVDKQIQAEANALNVLVCGFKVSPLVEVSSNWRWSYDYMKRRAQELFDKSNDPLLQDFFQNNELELKPFEDYINKLDYEAGNGE